MYCPCMVSAYAFASAPLPVKRGGYHKYPWDTMKVNRSFFVPKAKIGTMSGLAHRAGKRLGYTFTCADARKFPRKRRRSGVYVWRTA